MKINSRLLGLAAMATLTVAIANASGPVALDPGQTVWGLPEVIDEPTDLGTVIDTMWSVPFSGYDNASVNVFNGFMYTTVVRRPDQTLAFGYVMDNNYDSVDTLGRLSVTGYAGFKTDVAAGTPRPPYIVADLANRSSNGDVISFDWLSGVGQGVQTRYVWLLTDAKNYQKASASVIDGGVANTTIFAPAPVPEPASIAALGLGAVALIRRRRNR
jgi:hypothetical protein